MKEKKIQKREDKEKMKTKKKQGKQEKEKGGPGEGCSKSRFAPTCHGQHVRALKVRMTFAPRHSPNSKR